MPERSGGQAALELLRRNAGIDAGMQFEEVTGRVQSVHAERFEHLGVRGWMMHYRIDGVLIEDMTPNGEPRAQVGDVVRVQCGLIDLDEATLYRLQDIEILHSPGKTKG